MGKIECDMRKAGTWDENLYLCGVLDQDNAFMVRNELGQYVAERGLTTTCSTADKDVLALVSALQSPLFSQFSCP